MILKNENDLCESKKKEMTRDMSIDDMMILGIAGLHKDRRIFFKMPPKTPKDWIVLSGTENCNIKTNNYISFPT